VLLVLLTATAQLAKTQPSLPEEVSAPTALTHATLVMPLEPAPVASADSTSSKVLVKLPVLLELFPLMESANALQASFPTVNV